MNYSHPPCTAAAAVPTIAAALAMAVAVAAPLAVGLPAYADLHAGGDPAEAIGDEPHMPPASPTLPVLDVGALVTLGDVPFNDAMRLDAMRLAVDDYNGNDEKRFAIRLSVHEFDRAAPVESYRAAVDSGPLLFIGPTTSEPVAAIAGLATADGVIIVSPASSAMSLAVAGDNVFRLSPDGYLQASAMAGLVDGAGADGAFLVAQDDRYGRDLDAALSEILELRGIAVEGRFFFGRGAADWGLLAADLDDALSMSGAAGPAVVFIGVDEDFAGLAAEAETGGYASLGAARWIDSGAVENSPLVAADRHAAAFAEKTGFATPVPSAEPNEQSRRIDRIVGGRTGGSPHMFEYGAYDAVFLLAAAAAESGFPAAPLDAAAVRDALPGVAERYVGALGDVRLDAAGDLIRPDDHTVWSLSGGEWVRTGTVHAARAADENREIGRAHV